ncbi:hypothetical protein F2Q69_00051538 [Brassica cretica]|uniref:Uncharacterized protein n=1 Tax=Brassica cretica TaxID=69181 RepID=A0A8S9PVM7_BRACR|nr:hypothetical protein F2Q69_00051538 [Brassica cretica]
MIMLLFFILVNAPPFTLSLLLKVFIITWNLNNLNEEEQAVERIDGDGGVRVPSLVELTVVGSVKGGDEALQERIRHPGPTENGQIDVQFQDLHSARRRSSKPDFSWSSLSNDGLDCSLSELKKKKSVEPNSLNEARHIFNFLHKGDIAAVKQFTLKMMETELT